jgi:sortase A
VQAQWSYPALRQSPCVFSGSAQDGNLVVAAHNYSAHFGRLAQLRQGQTVRYTDGRGLTYTYQVAEITTLAPTAVDEMTSSDGWDLTMFTCTLGGQQRVTVRCTRTSLSA